VPAIHQLIPDPEHLLALEPEELAPALLQFIDSGSAHTAGRTSGPVKRGNVFTGTHTPGQLHSPKFANKIDEALLAAWAWLEREGLLVPAPQHQDRDWVVVSERGRKLLVKENFDAYKLALLFPRHRLHPAIASATFPLFLRGHYDTVVFEAFRAVEVAVRKAAGLSDSLVGVQLMRAAFGETGKLTDKAAVEGEREATGHLFAGAMGMFKNPTSHRTGSVTRPEDAISLVLFADYLLRFVDDRVAVLSKP
jgi:uncharacterized protein (TIGR02391 family)